MRTTAAAAHTADSEGQVQSSVPIAQYLSFARTTCEDGLLLELSSLSELNIACLAARPSPRLESIPTMGVAAT